MLKPEQVPDMVARDAAYAFYNATGPTVVDDWKSAVAAAINGWPGMDVRPTFAPTRVILPLSQEDTNAEA